MSATIEPGDVVSVVRTLRAAMSANDSAAFALTASFKNVNPAFEEPAKAAQRALDLAATRVYAMLRLLEATPAYKAAREVHLQSRSASAVIETDEGDEEGDER